LRCLGFCYSSRHRVRSLSLPFVQPRSKGSYGSIPIINVREGAGRKQYF
jgi:hypothetical protein